MTVKSLCKPWLMPLVGVLALVGGVGAALISYWRAANRLPAYPPATVVMPVPNGFDDLVEAARLCRSRPGDRIQRVPTKRGELRALVSSNRRALARLRQGLARPARRPPLLVWWYGSPDLGGFRQLALLLLAEGKLAELEGRTADAVRSYLDCLRLGAHAARGGGMMQSEYALMFQQLALKPLQELTGRLDGSTAAAAAREMCRLEAEAPTLVDALTVERDNVTLRMQQAFQDPEGWRQFAPAFVSNTGGEEPSRGRAAIARLRFGLLRKRPILDGMRGYLTSLIADGRVPYHARAGIPRFPADLFSPWLLIGPGQYDQSRRDWAIRDAWWRITAARLAARAYRQRHCAPPASLQVLVPALLPRVPADPFAPQPLRYRLQGARPLIYSRGPDADDDGGRDLGITVLPGAGRFPPPTDGDLISLEGMTEEGM
jgi:hypothetical protein